MNMTTGRRGIVWKTPDITADGLKMFACIAMLIQTIGVAVIEKGLIHLDQYTQDSLNQAMAQDSRLMTLAGIGSIMQLIGGMAIPVFTFLLVEGFRNTSDYKKYLLLMVLTAVISEIPYDLAVGGKIMDWSSQNAMVTMSICLMSGHLQGWFRIYRRAGQNADCAGCCGLGKSVQSGIWIMYGAFNSSILCVLYTEYFENSTWLYHQPHVYNRSPVFLWDLVLQR